MVLVCVARVAVSLSNNFTQKETNHPLTVKSSGSRFRFCPDLPVFPGTSHMISHSLPSFTGLRDVCNAFSSSQRTVVL